ncbi:Nuclear pore complex protein Nup54 [Rhynchospora pubera]|uniref:Nuclear pore complex protein Nup54 n=1 Tax=Rhynchospora pubera TaxID=906938 RepID=A0AAV8CCG2_9POAL|nr:Nuclear pore complex protein Nup54 [Rhynchospora pubera]
MFGAASSTPAFGTPSSTPAFGAPSSAPAFGVSSTPAFGTPSTTPAFGAPSSTPAFGAPSATPAFGAPSSTPAFGAPSSTPAFGATNFGAPSSTPAFGNTLFGTPSSTPACGTPSTPAFGTFSSTPAFGTPSTPAFGAPSASPLFPQQQQQQQLSPSPLLLGGPITTQMAPVAPLPYSLPDRDIQAIVDAYREEPDNPKYAFRHLLFSVTEPAARAKPISVPNTMWAEAMRKLEGMESSNRERLWPQLVQGFKDLSARLKLQDEVISSDADRLRMTHSNVKMLQRHFQADTLPWIQRLKQQELALQRRLLKIMKIVEALENKGFRMPLTNEEVQLRDKLVAMAKRIKGPGSDLSKRVYNLMSVSRVLVSSGGIGGPVYVPSSAKVDEQSILDLQEVLLQQTEAVAKLGNVLKRDARDLEIITSDNKDIIESSGNRDAFFGRPIVSLNV